MSYNQLKRAGVKLSPTGDADKDGKPNSLDCRPLNKKKQDDMPVQEIDEFLWQAEEQQKWKDLTKEAEKPFKDTTLKEESWFDKRRKRKEIEKDFAEERKVRELNTALKEKIKTTSEIDVRVLSEQELKALAVVEGKGLFGENQYERELKRRLKAQADLDTDLTIAKIEARRKEKEALKKYEKGIQDPQKKSGEDFFTWITR